jgi:aminopeptidase-like protein
MKYKVKEFDVRTGSCGNEKVYNSLGCEVPIGAIHRSPLGSYPEYDTSSDDLSFVNKKQLIDSFKVCQGAIETLERSQIFEHTFKGEPFLTGYGLYPKIEKDEDRIPYDYLMSFTTGKMTLVDIANRANLCVDEFDTAVKQMLNAGLIE